MTTHTDVLIIGAGPGGIAAAIAAGERGCKVIVLDDNAAPGGQIWRGGVASRKPQSEDEAKRGALERLARSGALVLGNHRVFDADPSSGSLQALREDQAGATAIRFTYKHLILATGARERFLPFPGWTLPGVFGAGGLQALVKGGFSVEGKRVVVAGTGPLLLAVAAHLRDYGAKVISVAEQASASQLAPFAASLWAHPAKIWQGLTYRASLWKTSYRTHCWPVAALGDAGGNTLRGVRLSDGKRSWDEPCDLLACGFHLVPNTELATLLGCTLRAAFVEVDNQQRTSVPNIFCVGEPTGIAGLDAALIQGEIAGLACAGQSTTALEGRAAAERAFGIRMEKAFALRPELRSLATPETIVCRCEDVSVSQLSCYTGWRDAKLQTRCGMGPCQGRICGPIVETLFNWEPASIRQPLFPVPLDAFCSNDENSELNSELIEENA
jgi:NADPH-dependent 2,4-dienoyl-CoA reductase/sulfur reductase-like enzyme